MEQDKIDDLKGRLRKLKTHGTIRDVADFLEVMLDDEFGPDVLVVPEVQKEAQIESKPEELKEEDFK